MYRQYNDCTNIYHDKRIMTLYQFKVHVYLRKDKTIVLGIE